MQIILDKKRNRWAIFCIIVGLLAVWLTIVHLTLRIGNFPMYLDFSEFYNLRNSPMDIYFFANSILIVFLGMFLNFKKYILYIVGSIVLFLSVFVGWFVPGVATEVGLGFLCWQYGGTIIVPLFHVVVISNFISAIKRLQGRTKYEGEISFLQDQQTIS
jgi:hypothetical protein